MEQKKANWYVRVLIVLLCLFIGWLIYTSFTWSIPPAKITSGIITLITFLTVLVLSEAFDNFSIGKLVTINRKLNEKEAQNKELKKENVDLRNQIINVTTNITQKQSNDTYLLGDELAKALNIKKANPDEIQEKQKEEATQTNTETTTTATTEPQTQEPSTRKYIPFRLFDEPAMAKFIAMEDLGNQNLVRDAKFGNQFQQIDPISEHSPIFDGYINTLEAEMFIELRLNGRLGGNLRDRLYLMLSKIYHYRTIKKVNAFLFLVLVNRPDDPPSSLIERTLQEFEPAITKGLLKVRYVDFSREEYEIIISKGDSGSQPSLF